MIFEICILHILNFKIMNTLSKFTLIFMLAAGMLIACSAPSADQQAEAAAPETAAAEEAAPAANAPAANGDAMAFQEGIVTWIGSEAIGGGKHNGTVNISGGNLVVADGNLVGGEFTLDMNTITCIDLADKPEKKANLEGHLKTGDFFEVETYPTATFQITGAEALAEPTEDATHTVSGNLTMRGVTKPISFPAKVTIADGMVSAQTPEFTINRTEWGVNFRSSIMDVAKDILINDDIVLAINIKAGKS